MKPSLYIIQNKAIHKAGAQLGLSLEDLRDKAGEINGGVRSLSKLSLSQRQELLQHLIGLGARVRNPHVYASDIKGEGKKVVAFPQPTEKQLRTCDTIAAQIHWREADGYRLFCFKLLKSARPRNHREVTKLKLALLSLRKQQQEKKKAEVA